MVKYFKFLFIILFNLYFTFCFSQKYEYLLANIIDTSIVTHKGGQLINNDKRIDSTFKKFNVFSYKYAYPKAKNEYLKRFVSIGCNCDVNEFAEFLKENYSIYFSDIEYFQDEVYMDYEPSDTMWHQTEPDGTPVLWHLKKIEADKAWNITKGGSDITISIIDHGFDISHPDLKNKIVDSVDPRTGDAFGYNTEYHGTSVSSFAGAETDGGGELASVGFNTMLRFYDLNFFPADIAYHASFEKGADVISFSFQVETSANLRDSLLVKEILDNGTVIVRSAGNTQSDSDNNRFPFAHQVDSRIIIVSSTDKNDYHTAPVGITHGNYPEVDICAPGYNIMRARRYDNGDNPYPYGLGSGTSYATPIVAGVCALLKSINKSLTPAEIKNIIQTTADPIADALLYPGTVGTGRINAYKSVLKALCDSNLPVLQREIIQHTTWNTPVYLNGTVIIQSGIILTITSSVYCTDNTKIIVQPGGKLIIDGGILTATCPDDMWNGIVVLGDPTQLQTPQYQGTVELKNGAVIEHALCAISAAPAGYENATGGMINATDAIFRNNLMAIEYLPYGNKILGERIASNIGKFTNCTFTFGGGNRFAANGKTFRRHTSLWGVRGITFEGCVFEDRTNIPSSAKLPAPENYGIYSMDASLKVINHCKKGGSTGGPECPCLTSHTTPSSFRNLVTGIRSENSGNPHQVYMDQSEFGILISAPE